jgi:phosphohistidine phosphatase
MQRLILFRHAEAEKSSATGEDFDRPLAAVGRDEALQAGRRLAEAGFAPELGLVSAARRTIQTWETAATAFPQARVDVLRELYNADSTTLLETVEAAAGRAQTVAVVAHNPGVGELAMRLGRHDGRLIRGFPTSAMAVFDVDGDAGYVLADVFMPDSGQ